MRGILSCSGYIPHRRLDRAEIAALFGGRPGKGTRAVAGFDEDTTTMGYEAARRALADAPDGADPDAVWFTTAAPAYLDTTNAAAIHAALRLDADVPAFDAVGAVRSTQGLMRSALAGFGTTLVVAADQRSGRPTSGEESSSGDGAAALVLGGADDEADLLAVCLGGWSRTAVALDRWRVPGEAHSRTWEERFGETQLVPLGEEVWNEALKALDLEASGIDRVIVTGLHARANKGLARRLGVAPEAFVDDLASTVGNTGVAHPALLLTHAVETAAPGQTIAVLTLADGADIVVFRTTERVADHGPSHPVTEQAAGGAPLPYGKFLAWTGAATPEPPNRPPPDRPSSSVAARNRDWKYGFVGSRDNSSGAVHLPPQRVSMDGGAVDDMAPVAMADATGTVTTYTVDRLVYSPSPPVTFAVIDFDDGGRLSCELTDVDADEVEIGMAVEMTFRRLSTSPDGIHNYFWKARPVRGRSDRQGGE